MDTTDQAEPINTHKKTYLIREGSFRMPDGSEKGTGETIELDSDVAAAHASKVLEVKDNGGKAVPVPDHGTAPVVDRLR